MLGLQDRLGKQIFHENKKIFEPLTDTNKNRSRDISETITETSIKNNEALVNLNNRLLEILNDTGISATY